MKLIQCTIKNFRKIAWLGTISNGPINYDQTIVNMDVGQQLTGGANVLTIQSTDTIIDNLGQASGFSTDIDHLICKYNYFHNRKIYFDFHDPGMYTLKLTLSSTLENKEI